MSKPVVTTIGFRLKMKRSQFLRLYKMKMIRRKLGAKSEGMKMIYILRENIQHKTKPVDLMSFLPKMVAISKTVRV